MTTGDVIIKALRMNRSDCLRKRLGTELLRTLIFKRQAEAGKSSHWKKVCKKEGPASCARWCDENKDEGWKTHCAWPQRPSLCPVSSISWVVRLKVGFSRFRRKWKIRNGLGVTVKGEWVTRGGRYRIKGRIRFLHLFLLANTSPGNVK